jgi:SAM-dependent methyltransferase
VVWFIGSQRGYSSVIQCLSRGIAENNMPEDILVELATAIHQHPWWQARAKLALGLIAANGIEPPARILDAGCGWGTTLFALEQAGFRAAGMDVSRRVLDRLDRPGRSLFEADLSCDILPGIMPPFDAILALDVIEHIDDDRAAVARLSRLIRPGGVLILSVPALPELFSEFDTIQGHRRRYLPDTLRAACDGAELEVARIFWWGQWLVPLLRRQRRKNKSQPGESAAQTYRRYLALPPWPVPWLMKLGFAREYRRTLEGRLRTGTSLFAVARRES